MRIHSSCTIGLCSELIHDYKVSPAGGKEREGNSLVSPPGRTLVRSSDGVLCRVPSAKTETLRMDYSLSSVHQKIIKVNVC